MKRRMKEESGLEAEPPFACLRTPTHYAPHDLVASTHFLLFLINPIQRPLLARSCNRDDNDGLFLPG